MSIPTSWHRAPWMLFIAVLALQMIAGRTSPWLPERAARTKLHGKFIDAMLGFFAKFFGGSGTKYTLAPLPERDSSESP